MNRFSIIIAVALTWVVIEDPLSWFCSGAIIVDVPEASIGVGLWAPNRDVSIFYTENFFNSCLACVLSQNQFWAGAITFCDNLVVGGTISNGDNFITVSSISNKDVASIDRVFAIWSSCTPRLRSISVHLHGLSVFNGALGGQVSIIVMPKELDVLSTDIVECHSHWMVPCLESDWVSDLSQILTR